MKWSKFSSSWVGNWVIGSLLENYWFLDSFGADLGEMDKYGMAGERCGLEFHIYWLISYQEFLDNWFLC